MGPKEKLISVKKHQIDDLIGAYNAAVNALGRPILKCAKCGGFHVDGYLCDCGTDPEDAGSKLVDLTIDWIPIYN